MVKGKRPIKLAGGWQDAPAHPQYWDVSQRDLAALQPLIDDGILEVLATKKK